MYRGCAGIPSRIWRCVGGRHPFTVEVGDETVVVFHPQPELPNRRRIVDVEGVSQVKRLGFVVELRAEVQRGTDEGLVAAAALVAGSLTAAFPGFVVELQSSPRAVVAVTGRHPAACVISRAQERVADPVHDDLHRAVGPLSKCVLDRILDHPGAAGRVLRLESQQAVRVVAAPAVAHHGRAMHGQAAQLAGFRASAKKTEAAGKIVLSVTPLAGGADGNNRFGLERPVQPHRMVVAQRVETHRLTGREIKHIRLDNRQLADVIKPEGLPLSSGSILDALAAIGFSTHSQDIHRRIADHLVQGRLLGRTHLSNGAVAGQLEGSRLADHNIHLENVALGVANDHGHITLVQPATADVATHRIAEPSRSLEVARWREHQLASLNGGRPRVSRHNLPDLRQRQAVFLPTINLLQVIGQHIVADLLARRGPGDVVHGERHLVRVAHRRRPSESPPGLSINLQRRCELLSLDIPEK